MLSAGGQYLCGQKAKQPIDKNWPKAETNDATAWPGNIGVLLGEPSDGLVDIDLDSPTARRLARVVLPHTPARFGRGDTVTHFFYDCGEAAPTTASTQFTRGFGDNKDKPLLEIRSTGGQTMVPPSTHPSGQRYSGSQTSRHHAPSKPPNCRALPPCWQPCRSCRDWIASFRPSM